MANQGRFIGALGKLVELVAMEGGSEHPMEIPRERITQKTLLRIVLAACWGRRLYYVKKLPEVWCLKTFLNHLLAPIAYNGSSLEPLFLTLDLRGVLRSRLSA